MNTTDLTNHVTAFPRFRSLFLRTFAWSFVGLAFLILPQAIRADYTATVSGSTVTFTSDGQSGVLVLGGQDGTLSYSTYPIGEVGNFKDFSSTQRIVETLSLIPVTKITIKGGPGDDMLVVNNSVGSVFAPNLLIDFNGGSGNNTLIIQGGSGPDSHVTYSPGPTNDAGVIETTNGLASLVINFSGLDPARDNVGAVAATDNGNLDDSAIRDARRPDGGISTVSTSPAAVDKTSPAAKGGIVIAGVTTNLAGALGPVTVAIGDNTPGSANPNTVITGYGAPVTLINVDTANLDATNQQVTATGTTQNDNIIYTPTGATKGTFYDNVGSGNNLVPNTVFNFINAAGNFRVFNDPNGNADRVTLRGSAARDLFEINQGSGVAQVLANNLTALLPVELGISIEILDAVGVGGENTFQVIPAPGLPGQAQDNLLINLNGGGSGANNALVIGSSFGASPGTLAANIFAVVNKGPIADTGTVRVFQAAVANPDINYTNVQVVSPNVSGDNVNPNLLVIGPDLNEPNEQLGNATFLGNAGTIQVQHATIFPKSLELPGTPADNDYYRVVAQSTGTLDFQAFYRTFNPALLPAGGNLNLRVLDAAGNVLGTGTTQVTIPATAGQSYFLHVAGATAAVINGYDASIINTPAPPTADLGITKLSSNPTPVAGGAAFAYTLTVTNFGPNDATDVVVNDPLPAGILLANNNIAIVPNTSGFSCTGPSIGTNGIVTCNASKMQVGVTETFTIVVQASADLAGGVRTNTATVTSGTSEPTLNLHANSASAVVTLTNNASLSISKTGLSTVCPGDTFIYQISVTNSGSSSGVNTQFTDTLPSATSFVSVVGNGDFAGNCSFNPGTGTVTCFTPFLRTGTSSAIITAKVNQNATGTITNNALLASAVGTIVGTNPASSVATVGCNGSLSIGNVTVTEGTGGQTNAVFTVSLSVPNTQTVSVDYLTSDGSATAGSDYTSQAGTLNFPPGTTTRTIVVPINPDNIPEPNETFNVTLLNSVNAGISSSTALGTINDDDASGSFQFNAASTTVGEATPTVTLTINRTGDTSGVASVGFETSDNTALQKGDYTFNSGTVQFGPGDTSKQISVSIINDALVEGAESFRVNLINPSGNFVVNSPGQFTVNITDDDAAPGPNPIDATAFFVRQQYLDFLGREPDAPGLTFWSNNINSCGADLNCIAVKRVDTSAAFFLSIEFQETSGNVIRTQRVAFNRLSSDPVSRVPYLTFMRDSRRVGAGVIIGQPGAEALLEANKQAYATQIVNSPAFIARFPVLPAPDYVDALFASAGVTPTAAERTAAINVFGGGGTIGRIAALRSVSDSNSVRAAELNSAFVLAEYFGYLRRNPTDAPDFNNAGYQFWLDKLNLFNGDFRAAEMVKAFITSLEYRGRFGP